MRLALISLVMIPLVVGCGGEDEEKRATDAGVIESVRILRRVVQDGDCGADISVSVKAMSESDAFEDCIEVPA